MGIIGKLITTKSDDFITNTVEKKLDYNIKAETYAPQGDDSPGLPDDRVLLVDIEGNGKMIVAGTLSISQGAEAGEKILYSRDSDNNVVAKIYFQKDGKIDIETDDEINITGSKKIIIDGTEDVEIKSTANVVFQDGTDFAVRYNELKSQLDTLKNDFNTFVTTYNAHVHVVNVTVNDITPGPSSASGTGAATPTPAAGSPTTADFTNTKVANVNLPGVGE